MNRNFSGNLRAKSGKKLSKNYRLVYGIVKAECGEGWRQNFVQPTQLVGKVVSNTTRLQYSVSSNITPSSGFC